MVMIVPPGTPAPTFDPSCLYSVVRNVSGVLKNFSFLPPHGKKLGINEEYAVFGNILEAVSGRQRWAGEQNRQALQNALVVDPPTLEIVHTPNVIIEDIGNASVKMLVANHGVLALTDPCWDDSLSDDEVFDQPV